MPIFRICIAILTTFSLSGCWGPLLNRAEQNDSLLVSAAPLCEDVPPWITEKDDRCVGVPKPPGLSEIQANPRASKIYVAGVVNESQYLCGRFVNALVLSSIGVHGNLDIATTVFSALGTAFTPIATVHALTAASSISSGWKTAIDSDVYAQSTIGNYAQVIQSTYYTDINRYVKELEKVSDDAIIPEIEISKIRPIHKECSLASAQAAIHASLLPPSPIVVPNTVTITVQSVKAKDTFSISGSSDSPKLTITTKPITASAQDKPNDIAAKLYLALESSPDFLTSGVVATIQGSVITLKGGGTINWKSVGTGSLKISSEEGSNTGATTATSPANTSPTTNSNTPGHGVNPR